MSSMVSSTHEAFSTITGETENWMSRFDRQASVQARYDIPTADGIVQVVIAPKLEKLEKLFHDRLRR